MILIFLALYSLQSISKTEATQNLPVDFLPRHIQTNSGISSSFPPECGIFQPQRSLEDIVSSCVATIFACAWVSVHPNIPAKDEAWWKKGLRRLELMFWSLVSPEFILSWAMRQWIGARRLARKYRANGWTKTHGYFLQMGGFMLYMNDSPVGVLSPELLEMLKESHSIAVPRISEDEIQDHSKSDALSKGLVVIQTTWFVAQCIARKRQGLIITQLELVTLAFATLNGLMYFLWWHKPLNVRTTMPIYLAGTNYNLAEMLNGRVIEQKPRSIGNLLLAGLEVLFFRFGDTIVANKISAGDMRVKTFYAYSDGSSVILFAILAGTSFGVIHCLGWNYVFPTHIELVAWRISSVIVTGIPPGFLLLSAIVAASDHSEGNSQGSVAQTFFGFTILLCIVLYFLARIVLLVEAGYSLRHLPPAALQVVRWTSLIPHI